ncbi:MAG: hypothetical protein IJC58_03985 [Oscillospiraceae bacterium]|nr:hypothetical protein [Oscillospiraceae bacterium]
MKRIKSLGLYQKGLLIFLSIAFIVFTAAYCAASSRVGYAFKKAILLPHHEGDSIIYTGRAFGEKISITVSDKTVTFSYEEETYGPYTVKEDPSAIVEDLDWPVTGVEILQNGNIFFRGSFYPDSSIGMLLFDEEGILGSFTTTANGVTYDSDGNPIDEMAPTVYDILKLTHDPDLTSKGVWSLWFFGILLSAFGVIHILFADEIFRHNLSFRIRNADRAEPSDWEIAMRYILWTFWAAAALISYWMGLTTIK